VRTPGRSDYGQGGGRAQRATYLPGFGGRNGFTDSYQSVKRFVRKLRAAQPERIWRLECQPGEELQLDFGLGAPIDDGQGKKRRSWACNVHHCRKGRSLPMRDHPSTLASVGLFRGDKPETQLHEHL
jgi:hypothetical protein